MCLIDLRFKFDFCFEKVFTKSIDHHLIIFVLFENFIICVVKAFQTIAYFLKNKKFIKS